MPLSGPRGSLSSVFIPAGRLGKDAGRGRQKAPLLQSLLQSPPLDALSLRQGASQAAGAAPTLRSGPAGDSAPWRRLSGVLGFVVGPLAPSTAVFRKSFVFSFFTYKEGFGFAFCGGVSPPLPVVSLLFSVSYPQDRRSYYLFFNYLFFNYLYRCSLSPEDRGSMCSLSPETDCFNVFAFTVENWPESHKPVEISDAWPCVVLPPVLLRGRYQRLHVAFFVRRDFQLLDERGFSQPPPSSYYLSLTTARPCSRSCARAVLTRAGRP